MMGIHRKQYIVDQPIRELELQRSFMLEVKLLQFTKYWWVFWFHRFYLSNKSHIWSYSRPCLRIIAFWVSCYDVRWKTIEKVCVHCQENPSHNKQWPCECRSNISPTSPVMFQSRGIIVHSYACLVLNGHPYTRLYFWKTLRTDTWRLLPMRINSGSKWPIWRAEQFATWCKNAAGTHKRKRCHFRTSPKSRTQTFLPKRSKTFFFFGTTWEV